MKTLAQRAMRISAIGIASASLSLLTACGGGGGGDSGGPLLQAYNRIQTCDQTLAELEAIVGRPADSTANGWVWLNDEEILFVYLHRGTNSELLSIGIVEYTRAKETTGHQRKDNCHVVS